MLRPARSSSGPLVSIIVPTRDGLDHLRRLLPALDRLVYRDIEVMVVDNGSTDGTAAWLGRQRFRFPLRTLSDPRNRSFSDANNHGVHEANGELISSSTTTRSRRATTSSATWSSACSTTRGGGGGREADLPAATGSPRPGRSRRPPTSRLQHRGRRLRHGRRRPGPASTSGGARTRSGPRHRTPRGPGRRPQPASSPAPGGVRGGRRAVGGLRVRHGGRRPRAQAARGRGPPRLRAAGDLLALRVGDPADRGRPGRVNAPDREPGALADSLGLPDRPRDAPRSPRRRAALGRGPLHVGDHPHA